MDSPESNVSPPAGNFWWLYLDESGDLGFDFVNKRPSRFFTVCILATSRPETNIRFRTAIRRTLRHKLNPKGKRKRWVEELKGAKTIFPIKQYVWKQVGDATFGIYCVTLNKKRLFPHLTEDKNRVYNYVSRLVVDQIPFEKANGKVQLIVDRSKGSKEILEFNRYITSSLQGRIDPDTSLAFTHEDSRSWPGLQLADMFAWGVFQKYEHKDATWYEVFKDKVRFDQQYL